MPEAKAVDKLIDLSLLEVRWQKLQYVRWQQISIFSQLHWVTSQNSPKNLEYDSANQTAGSRFFCQHTYMSLVPFEKS